MQDPELIFEPFAPDDVARLINDNIDLYNVAVTGVPEGWSVNFLLRNPRGAWLGGVMCMYWGGWLHVRSLWISEAIRGRGQGRRLLRAAEGYAVEIGGYASTLETFSPRARSFYEHCGYSVFGSLPDYPPGNTKYYLRKTLVSAAELAARQAALAASARAMKPPPSTREPSARS